MNLSLAFYSLGSHKIGNNTKELPKVESKRRSPPTSHHKTEVLKGYMFNIRRVEFPQLPGKLPGTKHAALKGEQKNFPQEFEATRSIKTSQ
jgi:hypothetical protein